jgi:hypothetical protein
MTGVPLAVLLARLENELESIRLAVTASHYVKARDAQQRAADLAKLMRESL